MSPLLTVVSWLGASLLLAGSPRLRRRPLAERLRPYLRGRRAPTATPGLRAELERRAVELGDVLARLGGITESTARRLERAHVPLDPQTFRTRQVGRAVIAAALVATIAPTAGASAIQSLAASLATAALALLLAEQDLVTRARSHQQRTERELPIVEEQLSMLLSAGWSIGAALDRIAERSSGVVAGDLAHVSQRVRQGLDHEAALREWSALVDVAGVDRLVRLLVLERHGGDLGRLVADEARAARLELHRRTIEDLERRAQLVWVPVTVATLVPGVLLLAIPFLEAMRLFTG